ncbi:DNA double-strand break repair nuclease NurA [Candidatus Woesearchaeota archaeon]|nr:DNA double-strand break repair nuclease NurA [Candidatus Woesearchaeota archaeon]
MINSYMKSKGGWQRYKNVWNYVFFMQSDVLKKIVEDIEISKEDKGEEKVVFGKKGYNSFVISKNNFSGIERKDGKRIAFIDGGNAEIIGSTDFSVQLVRVCGCIFENNKKTDEIKSEFFILINSFADGEDVFYKTKTYSVKGSVLLDNFSVNSMDSKIIEGGNRAKVSKAGEIARRICEIKIAEKIIEENETDAVIFDGTLECNLGEKEFLDKVYENALIKDVAVCGLAKTTNLFTNKGKNALSYIYRLGENKIWSYDNLVEIDNDEYKADISIIRLNEKSRHCFRFEIFNKQKESKKDVLGCLLDNCREISFPGYPYGLILADRYARVSSKEKEYLKSLFLAKAGGKIDEFIQEISSNDAHSILDSIN